MKLTLRKILLLAAAFVGVLVFVFSFVAAYRIVPSNNQWQQVNTFIWGARTTINYDGSSITASPDDALKAVALPIVGAILAILAGICLCVMVFAGEKLIKDKKIRMIVVLCAAGLLVLSGIFMFFARYGFENKNMVDGTLYKTVKDYREALAQVNIKVSCALPVVSGVLAILGGGAAVVSQFVKE